MKILFCLCKTVTVNVVLKHDLSLRLKSEIKTLALKDLFLKESSWLCDAEEELKQFNKSPQK